MQLHLFPRSIMRRLSAMGYKSPGQGDPGTRATVIDLGHHCTDREIASFTGRPVHAIRHHRRVTAINKYITDIYIRPRIVA